jgi:predicted transcriptional regulator
METEINKENLIQTVKAWVHVDNQIKQVNKVLKTLRDEKKEQNKKMISLMKMNNIDNFEMKDGQIQYKKYSKRESLTQKKLVEILSTHPQLQPDQVNMLNEFVYENRKMVNQEVIVRKLF